VGNPLPSGRLLNKPPDAPLAPSHQQASAVAKKYEERYADE